MSDQASDTKLVPGASDSLSEIGLLKSGPRISTRSNLVSLTFPHSQNKQCSGWAREAIPSSEWTSNAPALHGYRLGRPIVTGNLRSRADSPLPAGSRWLAAMASSPLVDLIPFRLWVVVVGSLLYAPRAPTFITKPADLSHSLRVRNQSCHSHTTSRGEALVPSNIIQNQFRRRGARCGSEPLPRAQARYCSLWDLL